MTMDTTNRRAPFIVIEGLDRSGKTTQTSKLHSRLQSVGVQANLMKFPDRTTPIGQMIDSYLRSASDLDDRAIHLLFSANRWEASSNIVKLLTEGTPIICDRYAFSGIAFSASKVSSDGSPLLPFEWCRGPDIGLPAPDLVIFFDISPEKAKERGGYGEERYEKEEMQARVRHAFHRLGEEMQSASGGTRWISLNAGRDKEEVEADVWTLVEPLVQEGMPATISRLWVETKVGASGQSTQ